MKPQHTARAAVDRQAHGISRAKRFERNGFLTAKEARIGTDGKGHRRLGTMLHQCDQSVAGADERALDRHWYGGHRCPSLWREDRDAVRGGIAPTHSERRRQKRGKDDRGKRAR
jgi:hypothetical protein